MGVATHLGPWLLGTNRYTSGTTAATTENMGCTVVSQSANVVFGTLTGNLISIPAGSQIVDVKVVEIDRQNRVRLSIKDLLEKPASEAPSAE